MARSPIKPITNNLKPVTKFFSRTQKPRKNRIELARQCMEEEQWSKAIKQWKAILKNICLLIFMRCELFQSFKVHRRAKFFFYKFTGKLALLLV